MSSSQLLIGISGPARAGKDQVASYIRRSAGVQNNNSIIIARLSHPLKNAAKELFGFSTVDMEEGKDSMHPRLGISPRRGLMDLGIVARGVSSTFLVDRLAERHADHFSARNAHIIIPDVRFLHDIWALKSYASYFQYETAFLHVTRCGGATRSPTTPPTVDIGDDMEELERHSDIHIINDGSLEALDAYVRSLSSELFSHA